MITKIISPTLLQQVLNSGTRERMLNKMYDIKYKKGINSIPKSGCTRKGFTLNEHISKYNV